MGHRFYFFTIFDHFEDDFFLTGHPALLVLVTLRPTENPSLRF
jgi:hypothetical protein